MIRGLVLGKFMPPHAGHLHLIEVARQMSDELYVVVGTLAGEPIDGDLRHRWMVELCGPNVRVLHLTDENPQDPSETPEFWSIWEASLRRILPAAPDRVFASEPYGARLAALFGATFVPVDPDRAAFPISATAIRADPVAAWRYLPPPVRPHYCRRICVLGPESSGKSTLAAALAAELDATLVPEFARALLEHRDGPPVEADMPLIAEGQVACEEAAARGDRPVIVCDTDALTTALWSDFLFGRVAPAVEALAARDYDLTLLCDIDIPYVDDPVRYLPARRREFFDRCRAELERRGRPYLLVSGDLESRLATCTARTAWRTRPGT